MGPGCQVLFRPLLLTLNTDPSAGDPSLGKTEVESQKKKSGEGTEQEKWGNTEQGKCESHGQELINEPLI